MNHSADPVRAARVRRRYGHDPGMPAVHHQGALAAEQAVAAGVGQRQVRRVAGRVLNCAPVEGQGRRGRIVQVLRPVAGRDGIREQQAGRARSRKVLCMGARPAGVERDARPARRCVGHHGLVKGHVDVNHSADPVRAARVRRRDRRDPRLRGVYSQAALAAEQAVAAGVGQRQVCCVAGRVDDCAAVEREGGRAVVAQVVRQVAGGDGVREPQRLRAVSRQVLRAAARVARPERDGGGSARLVDHHRLGKGHVDEDCMAQRVRGLGRVRRGDRRDDGRGVYQDGSAEAGGRQVALHDMVVAGTGPQLRGVQGKAVRVVEVDRIGVPRDGMAGYI